MRGGGSGDPPLPKRTNEDTADRLRQLARIAHDHKTVGAKLALQPFLIQIVSHTDRVDLEPAPTGEVTYVADVPLGRLPAVTIGGGVAVAEHHENPCLIWFGGLQYPPGAECDRKSVCIVVPVCDRPERIEASRPRLDIAKDDRAVPGEIRIFGCVPPDGELHALDPCDRVGEQDGGLSSNLRSRLAIGGPAHRARLVYQDAEMHLGLRLDLGPGEDPGNTESDLVETTFVDMAPPEPQLVLRLLLVTKRERRTGLLQEWPDIVERLLVDEPIRLRTNGIDPDVLAAVRRELTELVVLVGGDQLVFQAHELLDLAGYAWIDSTSAAPARRTHPIVRLGDLFAAGLFHREVAHLVERVFHSAYELLGRFG